jgi:hypothetical protein
MLLCGMGSRNKRLLVSYFLANLLVMCIFAASLPVFRVGLDVILKAKLSLVL